MNDAPKQQIAQDSSQGFIDAPGLMASQTAPVRVLLAAVIFSLGVVSTMTCGFPWPSVVVGLLVLTAFVWSGHTAWLFLFCLAAVGAQAFGDFDGYYRRSYRLISAKEYLQVGCVFLILVAGFRYAELKKYATAFGIDEKAGWERGLIARPTGGALLGTLLRRQWRFTVIALVVAFGTLSYFPPDNSYLYEYWLQPKPGRLIILSLLLFFGWFVCRSLVSLLDWIVLNPKRADIAFRSWYNRELWREMAGIEKRRQKLRNNDDSKF